MCSDHQRSRILALLYKAQTNIADETIGMSFSGRPALKPNSSSSMVLVLSYLVAQRIAIPE
eukprot:6485853-Amphidinium_carterae.1